MNYKLIAEENFEENEATISEKSPECLKEYHREISERISVLL